MELDDLKAYLRGFTDNFIQNFKQLRDDPGPQDSGSIGSKRQRSSGSKGKGIGEARVTRAFMWTRASRGRAIATIWTTTCH